MDAIVAKLIATETILYSFHLRDENVERVIKPAKKTYNKPVTVIVRYKKPFIVWVNSSDPYNDNPGLTMESANEDNNVYLVEDKYSEKFDGWLRKNFTIIFENELELMGSQSAALLARYARKEFPMKGSSFLCWNVW